VGTEVKGVYDSPSYPKPTPEAVRRFVAERPYVLVLGPGAQGHPAASLLPFALGPEGQIWVHMVQDDPTYQALAATGRASLWFEEFLAFTPHHLVDPAYAGMATLHFRAVLYEVAVTTTEEPAAVADVLARLLARYEPHDAYHPLSDVAWYAHDLRRLAAVTCTVLREQVKFKVAQNRTPEERERLVAFLRSRGLPGDARAADVIAGVAEEA